MAEFNINLMLSGSRIRYAWWAACDFLSDGEWHRLKEVQNVMIQAGVEPVVISTARNVLVRCRKAGIVQTRPINRDRPFTPWEVRLTPRQKMTLEAFEAIQASSQLRKECEA